MGKIDSIQTTCLKGHCRGNLASSELSTSTFIKLVKSIGHHTNCKFES